MFHLKVKDIKKVCRFLEDVKCIPLNGHFMYPVIKYEAIKGRLLSENIHSND